jgi:hypothetical protein
MISSCNIAEPDELDSVDPPIGLPSTQEELVDAIAGESGKEWKALTFELEGHSGFQLCRLDDAFMFFSNGTYRYDGGDVLCGGEDDSRIKTGTWEINFNSKKIIFDRTTNKEHDAEIVGIENGKILLRGQVDIFGLAMDIEGIYETTN